MAFEFPQIIDQKMKTAGKEHLFFSNPFLGLNFINTTSLGEHFCSLKQHPGSFSPQKSLENPGAIHDNLRNLDSHFMHDN